jgi:hypothetical protein
MVTETDWKRGENLPMHLEKNTVLVIEHGRMQAYGVMEDGQGLYYNTHLGPLRAGSEVSNGWDPERGRIYRGWKILQFSPFIYE